MALINYVRKEEATGQIAEVYKSIEERINILPNVLQFHTASPELFEKFMPFLGYYFDHPNLDSQTIAYIRMLISEYEGGEYCVRFQSAILKHLGVSESDLEQAKSDYTEINLDEKRKALVHFVLEIMRGKHDGFEMQIQKLREYGWTEKDIYEVSVMAALQKGMIQIVKAFKIEKDF